MDKKRKHEERMAAMKAFMSTNFPKIQYLHASLFPDKNGEPTANGFVEFASPKQARIVTTSVRSKDLKVSGHAAVKIKPAKTDIDMNRDWVLRSAGELVRKSPLSSGKVVTVKKAEGRGVYVNEALVFEQPGRYSRDGIFLGEFSDSKLR